MARAQPQLSCPSASLAAVVTTAINPSLRRSRPGHRSQRAIAGRRSSPASLSGRLPGDETSGRMRICSDRHRLPNRPRYRSALPRRIARYPRRHLGHRLGRRPDGLLRGAGQRCQRQTNRRGAVWADQDRQHEEVTMPDRDDAELRERTTGCHACSQIRILRPAAGKRVLTLGVRVTFAARYDRNSPAKPPSRLCPRQHLRADA
jgi:hypothetical protein